MQVWAFGGRVASEKRSSEATIMDGMADIAIIKVTSSLSLSLSLSLASLSLASLSRLSLPPSPEPQRHKHRTPHMPPWRAWLTSPSSRFHLSRCPANMQRFRGGLVFKAHRLCVSLNSRLESNKEEEERAGGWRRRSAAPRPASWRAWLTG